MPENDADPDSESRANDPPPLSGGSIYGSMPSSLSGRPMSGNVPPPPGGEGDSFAAPSPYQVTPAVADPAAALDAHLANRDDGALVLAHPGLRMAAMMIDVALIVIPFIVIGLAIDGSGFLDENSDPSDLALMVTGGYFLAYIIVHLVLLCTRGQTLGKMILRIKIVVHLTGETAGFVNAVLLRGFVGGLPSAVPCLGAIYYIVDCCFVFQAGHRTLHDLIGGTSVIKVPMVAKVPDEVVG